MYKYLKLIKSKKKSLNDKFSYKKHGSVLVLSVSSLWYLDASVNYVMFVIKFLIIVTYSWEVFQCKYWNDYKKKYNN